MAIVKETSASLIDELFGAPDVPLAPAEQAAVDKRKQFMDQVLAPESMAKYKLEVMFGHRHTARNPTPGIVSWWVSGNKLHGGGDCKLYLCDASVPELEGKGCKQFIPESAHGLQYMVCPHCQTMWQANQVVGEIFYRLPIQKWAEVLLKWYSKLELNADIYMKYARDDIRTAANKEQEKQLGGEVLAKARSFDRRSRYSYPLKNIIKDTAAGANLLDRIRAFLEA